MITFTTKFIPEFAPCLPPVFSTGQAIYFDIETTGLSAQSSYVYLIGCASEEEGAYSLTQWLCTEPSEEKELLRLFFDKVKDYQLVLHYNGTGFDLPFLEKKAKRHCLTNPLPHLENLDLCNRARRMKQLFSLPNLKQRTLEEFFGFTRTDVFSGSDLIGVYAQFLGLHHYNTLTQSSKETEEAALAHALLLHNAEDVKNLPSLTILLFLQSPAFAPDRHALLPVFSGPEAVTVSYRLPIRLEKTIRFTLPWNRTPLSLSVSGEGIVSISLPVYRGELKYFYPNPADYYYLPLEDCAMHKSVASFVEKEYRKKATAATCYTKRTGDFLPLGMTTKKEAPKKASASLPCFLSDYKSNYAYTPLTEELLEKGELLTALIQELLGTLL